MSECKDSCTLLFIEQARSEGGSTGSIDPLPPRSAASSTCIHVTVAVIAVNCLTFVLKYN